jgi:hypothetical protein
MAVEGRKDAKEKRRMEEEEIRILKRRKSKIIKNKKAKNERREAGHLDKSSQVIKKV